MHQLNKDHLFMAPWGYVWAIMECAMWTQIVLMKYLHSLLGIPGCHRLLYQWCSYRHLQIKISWLIQYIYKPIIEDCIEVMETQCRKTKESIKFPHRKVASIAFQFTRLPFGKIFPLKYLFKKTIIRSCHKYLVRDLERWSLKWFHLLRFTCT